MEYARWQAWLDKLMVVGFLERLLFMGMHTAQSMKLIAPYDYAYRAASPIGRISLLV